MGLDRLVVAAWIACNLAKGQTTPKFEVASIRPCSGEDATARNGRPNFSPGRLNLQCQSVKALIERAYVNWAGGHLHVWPPQLAIEAGPSWINSVSYRIEAKTDAPQGRGAMNGPMLQALLEDRFKLRIRRETRLGSAYILTVAKGGHKLQPFREGSCIRVDFETPIPPPVPGRPEPTICGMSDVTDRDYKLYGTAVADFATELAARLDHAVIDRTGITGMFNIELNLSSAELYPASLKSMDPSAPAAMATDSSAMFEAVRSAIGKLGLRLDRGRGAVEYLVIDSVERPSEN